MWEEEDVEAEVDEVDEEWCGTEDLLAEGFLLGELDECCERLLSL